jgi:hypothetical protein
VRGGCMPRGRRQHHAVVVEGQRGREAHLSSITVTRLGFRV